MFKFNTWQFWTAVLVALLLVVTVAGANEKKNFMSEKVITFLDGYENFYHKCVVYDETSDLKNATVDDVKSFIYTINQKFVNSGKMVWNDEFQFQGTTVLLATAVDDQYKGVWTIFKDRFCNSGFQKAVGS